MDSPVHIPVGFHAEPLLKVQHSLRALGRRRVVKIDERFAINLPVQGRKKTSCIHIILQN